jgi:aminomethyltransferase
LAAGADVSELPYFRFRTAEIGACPCVVSRTGYSGELGFEIFCEADDAARVWQALMDAGSAFGIRAYGMEAVDLLRTESALVIVEAEYTPGDHTPFEVNLGWAVKLDKPEFVGLEALREHARSNLARRLVGLDFGDADPPEDGTEVLHNGRPAGHASIVRRSPILGKTIGLAMLDTEAARSAEVDAGGARAKVVARLPFYDPDKRRPRA